MFLTARQSARADRLGLMAVNSAYKQKRQEIAPKYCVLCGAKHFQDKQTLCVTCYKGRKNA